MKINEIVARLEAAWVDLAVRYPVLQPLTTRVVVNRYARAAEPRPRPLSTVADYTSWTSLSDRTYSSRHLPPSESDYAAVPESEVVELFMRKAGAPEQPAKDTSVLFPYFAQWFTDSFLRTDPDDPRRNQSNHGIDLLQIYGTGEAQTRMLRAMQGGRLKSERHGDEEYGVRLFEDDAQGAPRLKPEFEGLYTESNFRRVFEDPRAPMRDEDKRLVIAVGLEHGNATIGNLAMNTVFLREHNRLAKLLRDAYPGWDDDRLFETARCINIAMLLKVVIEDYIPHISRVRIPLKALAGVWERERWYRSNWMAVEFNLLYRWHGLVPDRFTLGGESLDSGKMRRANALLFEHGLEEVLGAASRDAAGRIGVGHTPEFLRPVKVASVQLARQLKLQPYNAYRACFGLRPYRSFEELTGEPALAARLRALYGSVDEVEYLVGLAAEKRGEDDMMGELQLVMVAHDAFTHALTNPLLAEAVYNAATFSEVGMREIENTAGLASIVARNTGLEASSVSFERLPGAPAVAPVEAPSFAGTAPVV